MGKEANRQRKIKEWENKVVTRAHLTDYVDNRLRQELTAYHSHIVQPMWAWWQRREARWYRRLWRTLKAKFTRSDSDAPEEA